MAKKNKVCLTCGERYSYCSNCNRKDPYWMSSFHTEVCKSIFEICTRFNMNTVSKSEAKAALEQYNLSNKETLNSDIQRDLENIFQEEPKAKRKQPEAIVNEVVKQEE